MYIDKKLSINQISNKIQCSYWIVWKSMKDYGIKARSLSEANTLNNLKKKIVIQKNKLKDLYFNKRLSSLEIAKIYGCHHSVILHRLEENKIKRRDPVEANTKYPKKDFDGDNTDKSYLLGFALGDLNVRKTSKNGRTIVIQGNSTITEQIDLIDNLFKDYGPIKIRDISSGFTKEKRITLYLNDSFNFLLYKKDEIPKWIISNKNCFFAFLAGYVDAEGHIRTKLPTFLLINSYDKTILSQIYRNLIKFGVICPKPRISAKKGYISLKHTRPYIKDMWSFGVYSKQSLLYLFDGIKPYLKHKNKIEAMLKSREQIICRNEKYSYQRIGQVI